MSGKFYKPITIHCALYYSFILCPVFTLFFLPLVSSAWEANFSANPSVPELFLAIDKERQKLFVLSNKSPLQKLKEFSCSTGQVRGDKQKQGDRKTPEGIYFLEKRLSQGLDYDLYGKLAFTLNYPNPVDRIHGKTGYGIWIHGRGHKITEFETKGCVALNMSDIELLEHAGIILQKTPVVIARKASWQNDENNSGLETEIVQLTREWARYWSKKSNEFFSFYDEKKFTLSGQDFTQFKKRKKRLFQTYPWIDVYIHQPRALAGPGYVVSFFEQLYRTPSFFTTGIKRLYWQKYKNQEWKIVGGEWRQGATAMEKKLKDRYLEARKEKLIQWIESWRKAWEKADLKKYALFYTRDAVQGPIKGIKAILANKKKIWQNSGRPQKIECKNFEIRLDKAGFLISFVQKYKSEQGYTDLGIKRLTVTPFPSGWRITSESWRKLSCPMQNTM